MTTLTQLIEHYCPDGVEYVKLGDVATYYRGLTYSKKNEVESGGLKVLRANNVSLDTQRIDWNDVKAVELDKPVKRTCLLKQDDILMVANSGSKAHVGKIAYINQDFVDVAFGGFMATIRTKDPRSSRYVYHALSSDEFKAYKDRVLSSATINNLKKSIVEEFQIPLPPREVQDAIVERLDAFAKLIESLDSEIALREKRFEYFREQIFDAVLNDDQITRTPLGELGVTYGGLTGKIKKDFGHGTGKYVPYTAVFSNREVRFNDLEAVDVKPGERQRTIEAGDVLFTGSSESGPDPCLVDT